VVYYEMKALEGRFVLSGSLSEFIGRGQRAFSY